MSFKRRIQYILLTPSEKAIYNAMDEVEKLGADINLTEAIIALSKAKELVGDYIDEQLKKEYETASK